MKRKLLLKIIFSLFLVVISMLSVNNSSFAAAQNYNCTIVTNDLVDSSTKKINFVIGSQEISPNENYNLVVREPEGRFLFVKDGSDSRYVKVKFKPVADQNSNNFLINVNNFNGFQINRNGDFTFKKGTYFFNLVLDGKENVGGNYLCGDTGFKLDVPGTSENNFQFCEINLTPKSKIDPSVSINLKVNFKDSGFKENPSTKHHVKIFDTNNNSITREFEGPESIGPISAGCSSNGGCAPTSSVLESTNGLNIGAYQVGQYKVEVWDRDCAGIPLCGNETRSCWWSFDVKTKDNGGGGASNACKFCPLGTYKGPSDTNNPNSNPICKDQYGTTLEPKTCDLTKAAPNCSPVYGCTASFSYTAPETTRKLPLCPDGHIDKNGRCISIPSGLGVDLPTDVGGLVNKILAIFLGVVGGIAILIIIIAGYRLMMSQGNPEKIQTAKDMLTAAIVGFLFVIFSMVILQVIGYNILGIPGFGK